MFWGLWLPLLLFRARDEKDVWVWDESYWAQEMLKEKNPFRADWLLPSERIEEELFPRETTFDSDYGRAVKQQKAISCKEYCSANNNLLFLSLLTPILLV